MNKNNKIKLYARSISEVILKSKSPLNEEKIIKNFVDLLISTGYDKKSKEILSLAENIILNSQGKRKIIIETARKLKPNQRKSLECFIKTGDVIEEKINPELIAGLKIIINGSKQFDASMQSKLSRIFAGSRQTGRN